MRNTLVIGALLAGCLSSLAEAPLTPKQPVVTSVFYERPEADGGKESVLWRPCLNWQARGDVFCAARALGTPHGCVHVQRAGLQARSKHGVFHTPGAPPGFRASRLRQSTWPTGSE